MVVHMYAILCQLLHLEICTVHIYVYVYKAAGIWYSHNLQTIVGIELREIGLWERITQKSGLIATTLQSAELIFHHLFLVPVY